jgi:hypothetical protein
VNAADGGEGERRWVEAGRPTLPALILDGRPHPVLHVSQIAEALGLPPEAGGSPAEEGAAAWAVLDAWSALVAGAAWETLLQPTPARGRSLRNLTVNVFHPFELMPSAWKAGEFPWRPEEDAAREARLHDRGALLGFVRAAASGWQAFLASEDFAGPDPLVSSSRGPVRFSALVSFQRWHAAYHYRQLLHVLGVGDDGLLDSLALPREIF